MSIRWLMGLGFFYFMVHLTCGIIEGVWEAQQATETLNDLSGLSVLETGGLFGVPLLSMSFFSRLPELLTFDYPFLTGGYSVVRGILSCISIGIIFGLVMMFMPAIQGTLSRVLRL